MKPSLTHPKTVEIKSEKHERFEKVTGEYTTLINFINNGTKIIKKAYVKKSNFGRSQFKQKS